MARNTSMRQGRRYSMTEHGQTQSGFRTGNHLLRPGVADIWQLGFEKGPSTFRILPGLNPLRNEPNQPYFDPYRFSANDEQDALGLGDFIRVYPACRGFGDPQVTFIHMDPSDASGDQQMTPGWVLYRAIDRAVAAGQDRPGWAALLRGGRGRGAQLPRPGYVYLTQVVVMSHNGQIERQPRGLAEKTIVLELGQSAGMALAAELKAEREGFNGDPNDMENRYLNGDPVSLNLGRFVTFFTKSQGDPRQVQQQQVGSWNMAVAPQMGPQGRGGQGNMEPKGYGCFMEPTFGNPPFPANLAQFEAAVRARVLPWDDILQFPTIEQQAAYLADKFPPEVIDYAWREHRHWISEDVQRRIVSAVSAQVPGFPPGYAGYPQQGAPGQFQQPMYGAQGQLPPPYAGQPEYPAGAWPGQPQQAPGAGGFGVPASQPAPVYGQQPQQGYVAPPTQQFPPQQGFGAPAPQAPMAPPPPAGPPAGAMGWGMAPNQAAADTGLPAGMIQPGVPVGAVPSATMPMAAAATPRPGAEMLPAQPFNQGPPAGFDPRPQQQQVPQQQPQPQPQQQYVPQQPQGFGPPQQQQFPQPQQQYPQQQAYQPPQQPMPQQPSSPLPGQPAIPQQAAGMPAGAHVGPPAGMPMGMPAGMPVGAPNGAADALARAQARQSQQGGAPR